jgi:hypothetical protein
MVDLRRPDPGAPEDDSMRLNEAPMQSERTQHDRNRYPEQTAPFMIEAPASVVTVVPGAAHAAADSGMGAMLRAGSPIFQRAGQLVRPAMISARSSDGRTIQAPGIIPVTAPMLHRELGRATRWERLGRKGKAVPCDPPADVIAQIMNMVGEWDFRVLAATISTPTMRLDGSLLTSEGYDPATGLVLLGSPPVPSISDRPTKDDALAALRLLTDLLAEFPICNEEGRAVALSMMLTPILRGACGAAVPMHIGTAPEAGTGKSYLADIASVIATGNECPVVAAARDPDELEKRIGAVVLEAPPLISIDNINGVLGGDFICQVIERALVRVRPLGTSKSLLVPNTFTFFANGNNLTVAGDLVRRTIVMELDANSETPETRQFKNNPVAMVKAHRGRYIAAALTIGRAYVVAGSPGRPSPVPSFEGWSDLVRGALLWLGCADPVATMATARAEDPTRAMFGAIMESWPTDQAMYSAAELVSLAEQADGMGRLAWPDWSEAAHRVALDKRGKLSAEALGKWLARQKNKRIGGWKLARVGSVRRPLWQREGEGLEGRRGSFSFLAGEEQGASTVVSIEQLRRTSTKSPPSPLFDADDDQREGIVV